MAEAFPRVLQQLGLRYESLASLSDTISPLGNVSGTELVKFWREAVWRNAERVLNSKTPTDYRTVAASNVDSTSASIHSNALVWGNAIAAVQIPGSRARRDAYCRKQLDMLASRQKLTFSLPGNPWGHVFHGSLYVHASTATDAEPLPDLTFTLRDSRGRLVGRSKAVRLFGYLHDPLRLRRKVKAGRYKLTATATLTNGTTLTRTIVVRFPKRPAVRSRTASV
jgi:hypothetical protein